ncbi:MAG: DUF1311 domain-containing protein [Ruminococcaceae bacterium]|nr:DUF1311 domain-containing protein [Oscillospiraceae bacterium]
MKKIVCLLLITMQVFCFVPSCFAKNGDVIGYACYTDIVATINGAKIASYNVDGNTYVIAEDLKDYGFNVIWDANDRLIEVKRNYSVRDIYTNYQNPYISKNQIGKKAYNLLETDINASIGGYHLFSYRGKDFVRSYNIDGKTIIPFDMLDIFGKVEWNPLKRELSLSIPGVNQVDCANKNSQVIKSEYLSRVNDIETTIEYMANNAISQREMNSGAHLYYCMADVLLNEVYQYLKLALPSDQFELLKNDEIRWIGEKEALMKEMENMYEGGSIKQLMVSDSGAKYTIERCYYLISLIQ